MSIELNTVLQAARDKIAIFPDVTPLNNRILVALMDHTPGIPQRLNICSEIRSCHDAEALSALASLYSVMGFQRSELISSLITIELLAHVNSSAHCRQQNNETFGPPFPIFIR